MKHVKAFIAANSKAYLVFKPIAKEIEDGHQGLIERVAAAGILPEDYRPFVVAYVADDSKVAPNEATFAFTKYTAESNRVTYLMQVLTGVAAVKAAKRKALAEARKAGKTEKAENPFEAACAAIALCTPAQRKMLLALLAK
jgi:hypothetical protein